MNLRNPAMAALLVLAVPAARATLASQYQAPEVRLTAETVSFPLILVRGYPFIEGNVQGQKGKFMLDTGLQRAMSLNHHLIPLTGGAPAATGTFGSGQVFTIVMRPKVSDVNVGGLHFDNVTRVQSQDATQLERITPDFLGWFGYQAWAAYAMKIDYQQLNATFSRTGAEALLEGEKTVASIPYETRKLPNIPIVRGSLGGVNLLLHFDTGQRGGIYVDSATRDRWVENGFIVPQGDDTYDVKGLRIGDSFTVDVPRLRLWATPFPAADPTGINERITISLGYALLSQFVTVWDFPHKTLYFLRTSAYAQP
jgi:hypothetical protein